MQRYEFQLDIAAEKYLDYYRGTVKQVLVRCFNGQTIQFPAHLLKPFILASGIHGTFVLTCDDNRRGAELRRLPDGS